MRITIKEQRNQLGARLQEWAGQHGATVKVVSNQRKLWQCIFDNATTNAPTLVLCFDGETARGSFRDRNLLDRVDRQWVLVVLEGRGFTDPKDTSDEQLDDLNDVCEDLRQLVRRQRWMSAEAIDYVSLKPLPGVAQPNMANVHLDGYALTFSTAVDIPAITDTDPAAAGQQE